MLDTDFLEKIEGISLSDSQVSEVFVNIFQSMIDFIISSPEFIEQYHEKIENIETLTEIISIAEDDEEFQEAAENAISILERLQPQNGEE